MKSPLAILALAFGFIATESGFCSPGKIDLTFNAGSAVDGSIFEVAVQSDGKMIVGGYFNTVQGAARRHIAD